MILCMMNSLLSFRVEVFLPDSDCRLEPYRCERKRKGDTSKDAHDDLILEQKWNELADGCDCEKDEECDEKEDCESFHRIGILDVLENILIDFQVRQITRDCSFADEASDSQYRRSYRDDEGKVRRQKRQRIPIVLVTNLHRPDERKRYT